MLIHMYQILLHRRREEAFSLIKEKQQLFEHFHLSSQDPIDLSDTVKAIATDMPQ